MKYSRTALGLLNAQYRSVLRKCFLINAGLFALGAIAATPANATEYTTQQVLTSDTEYTASDSFNGSTSATGMYGGAIENTGHNLTINGSSFTGNYLNTGAASDARGGAIYQAGGELVINNASFVDNYTMRDLGGRAGAINTANATTTISNSEFKNNSTRTSTGENWVYGGMGAAIYQGGGTLTLNNNTFGGDTTAEGNKGAEGVIVSNGGEMIVNSNTFKNNNASGGIFNLQNDTTNVTFTGKNTFENNTGSPIYNWIVGDATTFANGSETVFKSNTANTKDQYGGPNNGGAIWNMEKIAFEEGSSVEFTDNHADGNGGAIYNYSIGTIDFNGAATFSGNTGGNGANDIYNAGTINFGGTADLAGGIDGSAGTVNVSGDVTIANALKNQTVNVNAGELALNAANVSGSTINLASDAVLNTINNAIDDYSAIKLADNSNIKVDANLNLGQMDLFSAKYGHDTVDLNVVEANMIGTSEEEVLMQLVNNGVQVNTSSVIYKDGTKTGIVGSGAADGKVKVSNDTTDSDLEKAAADTSSAVKESVVYEMSGDENFDDNQTIEKANFIIEGQKNDVNLSAILGIDKNSVVTINEAKFNGDGAITTYGQLIINDSEVNVDVNVLEGANLESDPTSYSGTVTVDSASTASFDGDTFESTALLKNSGTVDFTNMTFESGSKIEKDTTAGTLNFNGGDYDLVVTGNNINLKNGADIALIEGSNIDGLALTNDANGGTIDLRNNKIDTLGSTALSSDLNVLMDIDLSTDKSDNLGTISGTGGLNLQAVELLALGGATEDIQIATAGTNVVISSDAENTLKTYYSTVGYDSGTGILSLSGKAAYASADLVGTWGSGNYIKAYNASDSANTSVGANLGYLDTQVKANEDAIAQNASDIAQNASDIADINTAITVTADGNYIKAADDVKTNLGALDTQVKANADAIAGKQDTLTAGSGIDITSNTISVKDASLANFDASKVTDSTEVAALLANPTTASDANVLTEKAVVTGIGALFDEKQAWVDSTLGITSANPDAVKEQYASTNYLKEATTLTGADKALDSALKANAEIDATQSATMNTLAGIVNGGSVAADGTYTAGEALTAYNSKSTLTGVVNALETNKQENLVINANSGLKWTDAKQTQLAIKLADTTATKSGLQLSDDGLSIKTGDTMQITNEGYLNIKYDTNTFTTDDTVGLKIANKGIKTAMLDDGAVTFDKLASSVYSTTVGTGSDTVLATTSAVKAYSDSAIAEAITFNSDNTVTLKVGSNSADIYDTTGTANYVKANAQNADYTALTSGAVDLTSNSSIAQALQTLDAKKASLEKDNTFTGANTFKSDSGITIQNKTTPAVSSNLVAKQLTIGTETHDILELTVSDSTSKGSALYVKNADVVTNSGFMALDNTGMDRFSADGNALELKDASGNTTFNVNTATGDIYAANGEFTVDKNGNTVVKGEFKAGANGTEFQVGSTGNVYADGNIQGKSFSNTDGSFQVGSTGNVYVGTDKFTVMADSGNVTTKGTVNINGATLTGSDTALTSDKKIVSANGFEVDANNSLTSAGLTASTANIAGNTTIGGTLDVTGLSSLDGGIDVNGGKFTVDTDGAVSAANGEFTVDKNGNTVVKGEFKAGANGTEFQVGSTGNVYADGSINSKKDVIAAGKVQGNTFTNTNGSFQVGSTGNVYAQALAFNSDQTKMVNAIDQGAAAITDGDATTTARKETMATTATVAKTIGNLAALENTHGVTSVADVASAIDSLATNVQTATGGTFANAVWTGKVTVGTTTDYTYGGDTGYNNIMAAVSNIASNIGAATTAANGNITKSKTVNANLDQLDGAIGDRSNLGSGNEAINTGTKTSVAAGLKAAGDAIGDMNFGTSHYVAGNNDLSGAVRTLDSNLYRVETDLRDLKRDFNRGMASMAAMSALVPNPRAHGNTSLAIGTGAYSGHTAAAIGGFHYLTDNIMLNAGAAWGNSSDASYRLGVTFSW